MSRNDDGFNLDDMMEIFGDSAELPAKKEEAPARPVAVAPTPAPAPAPAASGSEDGGLSDDELAILEAYEKSKKEQKNKEEEAKRKKEDEARKILEEYEKQLAEAKAREDRLRKELEDRQKRDLEELKAKQAQAAVIDKEAEERRIIEEFEKSIREQKEKDDASRKVQEEKAQAELKKLAEQQKAEEEARKAEEAKKDQELQAKAVATVGDKKESRLMELLAKAKADLDSVAAAPLPSASASPASGAAADPGPKASAAEILIDIETKENAAFMIMLDETRKVMFTFLAPMIGIKATTNMLNKTVEKARAKAPVLLKDANWKQDGSLREDGSVDSDRMLGNVQKIPMATRVDDYLGGLHELVDMRLKAVDAGLGAKTGVDLRMKLADLRRSFENKGIKPEWIDLFFKNVVS